MGDSARTHPGLAWAGGGGHLRSSTLGMAADAIGLQLARLANGVGAVGGLAHDQQPWLGGEDRGEAFPDHGLVVGDQAPRGRIAACLAIRCHAVPPRGSTAETTKPPSGAGPADSEPPSSATRSRIPVSP